MPNHVKNIIVIDAPNGVEIMKTKLLNSDGFIDFEVLLPVPINSWMFNSGSLHKDSFPRDALSWCRENWSTKWNAYGQGEKGNPVGFSVVEDKINLEFQTAWSPPRGWVLGVFNTFKSNISHKWHDEGVGLANLDTYVWADDIMGPQFKTASIDEKLWSWDEDDE